MAEWSKALRSGRSPLLWAAGFRNPPMPLGFICGASPGLVVCWHFHQITKQDYRLQYTVVRLPSLWGLTVEERYTHLYHHCQHLGGCIMKKRTKAPTTSSTSTKAVKKQPEDKPKNTPVFDDEEENSGFSNWLRTGQGVEFMKVFVILNSIGVFLTLGWPSISKSYYIVRSFFYDDEELTY
ncbi:uncharacterized protein LOC124363547 [Homalodisca vitripennis]|uniref:uncharacterized protein LOC124363547 n=1 Tax=Homalodisca vitripennis TaxID=197043 RepID=UPI001EEC0755|nr:uncharacterized protein LOC124363547 [Homalodisca vitripennis]